MIVNSLSNLGFLFLSRCLIFKVQLLSSQLSRLEDSSKSISHQISSCQYFLKSFFTFFVLTFLLGFLLFAESSIIISFCTRKVKSFWAVLQGFRTTFPGVFEMLQGGVVWGVSGHKMWVLDMEKPPSFFRKRLFFYLFFRKSSASQSTFPG